jgi:DNA primase
MSTIDFAAIKASVSIEQVANMLGVKLTAHRDQLRGACPITKSTDPRSFVITPSKGVYFSFKEGKGGDALTLVSKVRGCSIREAAEIIAAHFGAEKSNSPPLPKQEEKEKRRGFDVEAYAKGLDPAHEALSPLGIGEETYRQWKAGYSGSGVLRGKLALPVAAKDGAVVGYVGRALKDETPTLLFPNGLSPSEFIFGADKVTEGELYLVRDPIDVLRASENGVENAVCFLCEITPQMLEMLSSLMDEKHCQTVALF